MSDTPIKQILLSISVILASCSGSVRHEEWLVKAIESATHQLRKAAIIYSPEKVPRSFDYSGDIIYADHKDWTAGFFPGSLWYAYEITRDSFFLNQAIRYTEGMDSSAGIKSTHDLGFMIFCSYGNAYRLTKNPAYAEKIIEASANLALRYNTKVDAIRSWDWGRWEYPVIIDNMMNLEMLLWTADYADIDTYRKIAVQHANTTLEYHFRDDFSAYHVINFDTLTGRVINKQTHQGYSNESSWARGQAWALYAFTMMYEYTGDNTFLKHAKQIAGYILTHERMPGDHVPYWDFDDPEIPFTYQDASSASIMASAFLALSENVNNRLSKKYFNQAENILKSLASGRYLSETDKNGFFILQHSVGNFPENTEIDVSINYADYYFLEALIKYMEAMNVELPAEIM